MGAGGLMALASGVAAGVQGAVAAGWRILADCGGASTVLIDCGSGENGIIHVICLVISVLAVVIGVVAVIGLMWAGVQYLTAADNEEQVRKSKKRIYHVIIGLAVYALMMPLLNFLLPGGIFGCTI